MSVFSLLIHFMCHGRRSVRVEVANPRRSTRLTPASINGVHPVTPHHDTFVHTDFEVESGSQAAAYRYAMEDSELDNLPTTSSAISSASPAVGRRKTPQRKKAAATAPTSSARRSSNRHKPVSGKYLVGGHVCTCGCVCGGGGGGLCGMYVCIDLP